MRNNENVDSRKVVYYQEGTTLKYSVMPGANTAGYGFVEDEPLNGMYVHPGLDVLRETVSSKHIQVIMREGRKIQKSIDEEGLDHSKAWHKWARGQI